MSTSPFDLNVRYLIYRTFAENCKAPSYQEIAALVGEAEERTRASFHALHAHHMIFLEPGSDSIRMANPFSAAPTRIRLNRAESSGGLTAPGIRWGSLRRYTAMQPLRPDIQIAAGQLNCGLRMGQWTEKGMWCTSPCPAASGINQFVHGIRADDGD
jgi:hypothetical protein